MRLISYSHDRPESIRVALRERREHLLVDSDALLAQVAEQAGEGGALGAGGGGHLNCPATAAGAANPGALLSVEVAAASRAGNDFAALGNPEPAGVGLVGLHRLVGAETTGKGRR